MPFKRVHEIAAGSIPELARSIIAAGDELVAVLVEAAVGEGKHMAFQFLNEFELLLSLLLYFLDQL